MRIIRPQQLVVLKNSYQIGYNSHMGISVVVGFYLSRPEQLITESQIWQAWKNAPLSLRILDSAEPKPWAEFLLAGHAGIGEAVTALDVKACVGSLTRRWRVEGESGKTGLTIQPFLRIPLDHTQSFGGKGCKENPLGRGYNDNQTPLLMSVGFDGTANVRSPLASPGPVPHDFHSRKSYLDEVVSSMTDPAYLETYYPGLPPEINPRYFQMAAPEQWLKKAAWPGEIPFSLTGFRPNGETLSGEFPQVNARAFSWSNNCSQPDEITLLRKTLWLLPDDDIGLIVFTGSLPISHLFDEPVETLMVGLETNGRPKDDAHYQHVYQKRRAEGVPDFEFLKDQDLMPEGAMLNVIRSLADHPDSLRYQPAPLSEAEINAFYQQVEEAIERQQQQQKIRKEAAPALKIPPADNEESGTVWLANMQDEAINLLFSATSFSGMTLTDKAFRYCTFNQCSFEKTTFKNCTFEHCQFTGGNLLQTHWEKTLIAHCLFTDLSVEESTFIEGHWSKSTLEKLVFKHTVFTRQQWNNCLINEGESLHCRLEETSMTGCFFSQTRSNTLHFEQVRITSCMYEKCTAYALTFTKSTLEKTSLITTCWQASHFSHCYFNSFTTGLNTDLSTSHFEECSMNKIGFLGVNLQDSHFHHCALQEGCCDKADLTQASIIACDMTQIRLKDAQLTHSHWQNSSLQQGMFYNADLRDTCFQRCNLAGANLAMTAQNLSTHFEHCLMEKTHWIPRRIRGMRHQHA